MSPIHTIVCLIVAMATQYVLCCSPTEELPLARKVESASVLLLGEVIKHYDTRRHIGKAYTAEMRIYCVLKAPTDYPISVIHNVTEAGVVDARCYSVNLEVGKEYIVLGYVSDGELRPYDDAIEGTPDKIQEVASICGMAPRLPDGHSTGDPQFCPTEVDDEGCIMNTPMSNNANNHDKEHDHDGDGVHTHDDHHVGDDQASDDHSHDDHDHDHDDIHDHDEHLHDDHDHDHDHDHDEHLHDGNEHDHDGDGKHTHEDHHDGHDHASDDHDHEDHHGNDDDNSHDHDHEKIMEVRGSASAAHQALFVVISGIAVYFL